MKLECVGSIAVRGVLVQLLRQVDDLNGFKRAFLAHTKVRYSSIYSSNMPFSSDSAADRVSTIFLQRLQAHIK
jgi:hypothetical protein